MCPTFVEDFTSYHTNRRLEKPRLKATKLAGNISEMGEVICLVELA
jgi:hypothetical protein